MIQNYETICLIAGLVLGMSYYQKTGLACGGIITPAFFAIYIHQTRELAVSLAAGVAICFILEILVRKLGLYGRQRLTVAMLIAILVKVFFIDYVSDGSLWLGWIIPGLVAADMQKQGLVSTLSSVFSIGIASAMSAKLFLFLTV